MKDWTPLAMIGGAVALLFLTGSGKTRQPQNEIDHAILNFGGKLLSPPSGQPPRNDPNEVGRFTTFLTRSGVRRINPTQLAYPADSDVEEMRELGYTHLVPPRVWWPRAVLIGLVADHLASQVGPVEVSDYYRPEDFNEEVGGTSGSKHIQALAADLDLSSTEAKERAFAIMEAMQDNVPQLRIGLGVGRRRRLHVDLLSDRSRASTWYY
jgi:hypothetical protein